MRPDQEITDVHREVALTGKSWEAAGFPPETGKPPKSAPADARQSAFSVTYRAQAEPGRDAVVWRAWHDQILRQHKTLWDRHRSTCVANGVSRDVFVRRLQIGWAPGEASRAQ